DLVAPVWPEVARRRDQARAAAQRERRGTGRECRALAEEVDRDTVTGEIAIAEQTDRLVGAQGGEGLGPGPRGQRHHAHPEVWSRLDEPLEQLRWFHGLGDDGDRVPASPEPRAGEVPVAEVREREHDAVAGRQRGIEVLDATYVDVLVDPRLRRSGESEQLV